MKKTFPPQMASFLEQHLHACAERRWLDARDLLRKAYENGERGSVTATGRGGMVYSRVDAKAVLAGRPQAARAHVLQERTSTHEYGF